LARALTQNRHPLLLVARRLQSGEFWGKPCAGGRREQGITTMARRPGSRSEFVFFDVIYEDGSQRSNRRVPADLLGGLERDEPAKVFIEEQDREISEKSGLAPLKIKTLWRAGEKPKERTQARRNG
jgi:hypothetical protein